MAYAAVISLEATINDLLDSPRLSLVPPSRKIIKFAYRELRSLREILRRLDASGTSSTRKNVNALDARIKEAVWGFEDLLESHVYAQILPQSGREEKVSDSVVWMQKSKREVWRFDGFIESRVVYYWKLPHFEFLEVNLGELRDDVDSFIKMLKEKEKEYVYELDNPLPEEEAFDAAVVSPATDSGAKRFKTVGSSDLLSKIRDQLDSRTGFAVMPIAGMAGIGKTTIAKEIFDDDTLIFSDLGFECRAWVTIGRKFELDKLEREILTQLDHGMARELREGGEGKEGQYLRKFWRLRDA